MDIPALAQLFLPSRTTPFLRLIARDITIGLDENGSYLLTPEQLDDGSGDICGYSLNISQTAFDCNDLGSTPITLTVTDTHGNQSTCSANVTIEDNIPPVAICNDFTVSLHSSLVSISHFNYAATGLSTDNCSGTLVPTILSSSIFYCDDIGPNLVTFQVRDQQNNTSTCVSTFTVEDTGIPEAYCQDLTIQLDATGNASISPEEVDADSYENCTISALTLSQSTFDCTEVGSNITFLTVTDQSGNSSSCSANITLEDNIAIGISCPDDLVVPTDPGSCSGTFTVPLPTIEDNCDPKLLSYRYRPVDEMGNNIPNTSWSYTYYYINATQTLGLGYWKILWEAYDYSYNLVKCTFFVEVIDEEKPTAVCFHPTLTFNGEASFDLSISDLWNEAASSDNCGDVFFVDQSMTQITCDQAGNIIPVTVTIEDTNGNTQDCIANVNVTGLPCDWEVDPAGIGCNPAEAGFSAPGVFTVTTQGCYDPAYYRQNDQEGFDQRELCGDGEIITQVTDVIGNGWAGIVMRESNDPSARMIQLMIDGNALTRREVRMSPGSFAYASMFQNLGKIWLRLSRSGNQFSAYHSLDGLNWGIVFSANIPMNNCIEIGLMTMNGAPSGEVTGIFENVSVVGGVGNALMAPPPVGNALDISPEMDFTLYPNPATDLVQLQFDQFIDKPVDLRIYNQLGQIVVQFQWKNLDGGAQQINIGDLQAGTYIVEISSEEKRVSKKLVVAGR